MRIIIHFPQESAAPSSMSDYRDLLVNGLVKLGYEVRVVSKMRLLQSASSGMRGRLLSKIPSILSTWPTLWREHNTSPDTWFVNISQEYVLPFAASRSINIVHDLIQIDFPRSPAVRWFYRNLLPRLARHAALNISVSKTTAESLAGLGVPSNVVYNEFPLDNPPPNREPSQRQFTACWVGTLAPHKNMRDYLATATAMPDRAFAAVLPEAHAVRLEADPSLAQNLTVYHSLPRHRYVEVLSNSQFIVSTSLTEGFGRPPADGVMAGCDMVVSDIPIYHELYEGLAHFYAPGDVDGLVRILSSPARASRDAARRRFQEWNDQPKLVDVIDRRVGGQLSPS